MEGRMSEHEPSKIEKAVAIGEEFTIFEQNHTVEERIGKKTISIKSPVELTTPDGKKVHLDLMAYDDSEERHTRTKGECVAPFDPQEGYSPRLRDKDYGKQINRRKVPFEFGVSESLKDMELRTDLSPEDRNRLRQNLRLQVTFPGGSVFEGRPSSMTDEVGFSKFNPGTDIETEDYDKELGIETPLHDEGFFIRLPNDRKLREIKAKFVLRDDGKSANPDELTKARLSVPEISNVLTSEEPKLSDGGVDSPRETFRISHEEQKELGRLLSRSEKAVETDPLTVEPAASDEAVMPDDAKKVESASVPEEERGTETEAQEWARIIRDEGFGYLHSRFNPNWEYTTPEGNKEKVLVPGKSGGGFTDVAEFGSVDRWWSKFGSVSAEMADMPYARRPKDHANFLVVAPTDEMSDRLSLNYVTWLHPKTAFDLRGRCPLQFRFSLPMGVGQELLNRVENGNADLVEEIFQKVFPDLTGTERGVNAQRLLTNELIILQRSAVNTMQRPVRKELRYARSVGEEPWVER